ncbi:MULTISPECIES: type III secretion system export apparatus subunit SctT [Burkholderia]|uniref:type III secretion system export apparatus subunit SctT n=1 Tax=Burkholderia TaxID=32008 RepID=UPI00075D7489|nr:MULTISPECIES: type III secretion system export apparatus subunit SctT [Burkholderia]AOJ73621.1 type III secretion system protein [Burkholderia savannae]KVG38951.1 type III secretion system protein [Burkholderia sp. MSMB0265]KVG81676.1 type III secretion system protein [Burkholderia sp. MSMB2040]KVG98835.1 type III secretion system protein [Burkholderia sp. MSMB2042]KVG99014.1 type III secretion system protein [Burkholderia sp. MSMB2041]
MEVFYLHLGAFAIAYARIAPVFYLLPFLNDRTIVNGMLKNTIVFAVIVGLWPSFAHPHSSSGGALLGIALTEGAAGLVLGVGLSLPFWVATAIGELIDNQRGATISDSIDPATGVEASAFAPFVSLFYAAAFLQQGGMLTIVEQLESSYAAVPTGALFNVDLSRIGTLLNDLVAHGLALGAPVLIVMFLTDALLGLFARFCPQVNAFSLSLTVKSIVAFSVFHLYFVSAAPHELTALLHVHSFSKLVK